MSPELILLLIVFILLPLIQQLLRARALPQQSTPDQTTNRPARAGQPEQRSAVRTPLGRGPAGPRVPAMARRQSADAAEDEITAPLKAVAPAMRVSPGAPGTRRHMAVAGLRSSPDLRRSILLMTILGACRAIDPYASPERTARR